MTTEVNNWRLQGWEIQGEDSGDKYWWGAYIEEKPGPEGKPFEPFIGVITGRAWIKHDTLLMTSWKVHDEAEDIDTWADVEKRFNSLPMWDKTKYFVKLADIGMSGLMDCQTGEEAPVEVADVIMPLLGFEKVGG